MAPLRCPRGHHWELDDSEAGSLASGVAVACPVCGVTWAPGDTQAAVRIPDLPPAAPDSLPGFEIQGTLGRGGMGVVYKARHIKTDRVVAPKVPHPDHADLSLRLRFQAEARAVARLQHPNIVQVFEVGEANGRPYLALEYCAGGSLADRFDGTPQPPRLAAELAHAVALAVAHAHRQGVIHRDLKPANILLNAECGMRNAEFNSAFRIPHSAFVPKVADFGLARRTDIDAGQTRTGAVIGTPSYMAPEQARGDGKRVGPAADIYSLGAVLYECLTGRPPFNGPTVLDTLDQVCNREPVPPSRFQPGVPRDLETITLACLRKEPGKRYPSADALADDLQRFLDGRPILARPVRWPERLWKLARRNPVPAALVVLLAAAIAGGVGAVAWKQVRLVAERDRARGHFQRSMRVIDELLTEVAEQDLASEPRAERTRQALLEKALRFYEELQGAEAGDPEVAWEAARAARRVGDIHRLLGHYPDALAAYDQALERLARLRAGGRDDADCRRKIARCHNGRGEVHRLCDRADAADAAYREAIAELTALRSTDAGDARELAQCLYNRGIVAGNRGRYAEAEERFREATAALPAAGDRLPDHDQHAARIALNLSDVLRKENRPADAATAAASAAGILDALIAAFPDHPAYRHERAAAGINLAIARSATGDNPGAVAAAADARRRLEKLVEDFPSVAAYRADLAVACRTLGVLENAGDPRAAEAHTRAAVGHWESLLAARPDVPAYHGELGLALGNLGRMTRARPEEARGYLTRALPEVLAALRANADDADFRQSLARLARELADNLARAGDDAAIARQADAIRDGLGGHPHGPYRAVCFLARAATAAGPGPRADAFARQAIAMVRGGDATALAPLRDDPDYDPFRQQPAFRSAFVRP